MKLPSVQYLAQSAGRAFIRFPFSILSALVGVCAGVTLIENHDNITNLLPLINLMLTGGLGIGLFFCVDVFSYNRGYPRGKRWLFDLGAFLVLVLIYFSLPGQESTFNTTVPYIRFAIYSIVIHLVVAFIPFVSKGQINGFWNYNKLLLVRVLTSALYSGVLYGGLALALGSMDFLFDVDLHEELFGDMFVVIAGLFNTIFFLAGIPETFHDLDDIRVYPKGIRVFSQYILLPLLILYLIILYVYGGKIIAMWSWPKGIVSYLITCVGVLGILTILLLYPYGNEPGNGWMKKFSRWYYVVLMPLVGLLFYAIIVRMGDYGITINRYIVILLGIWLTIVSIYFIVGKTNIKFIPVSLAVIMLVVSFGWWGMFSVSERSQVNRLRSILENSKILEGGRIKGEVLWDLDSIPQFLALSTESVNDKVLSDSLHNEVYSIIDYLDEHHGFSSIREWYAQDLDSIIRVSHEKKKDRWSGVSEDNVYMRSLGLTHQRRYKYNSATIDYWRNSTDETVMTVSGFDYLLSNETYSADYSGHFDHSSFSIDGIDYEIRPHALITDRLTITSASDTIVFDTDVALKKLLAHYGRTDSHIDFDPIHGRSTTLGWEARFLPSHIRFDIKNDSVFLDGLSGEVLLKRVK